MNATICHDIILEAIKADDVAKARTYAELLQKWLDDGSDYPTNTRNGLVASLLYELRRPRCYLEAVKRDFASLTCYSCDVGMHITSLTQAIDEGWSELQPDHEQWLTSHLGTCPECQLRTLREWLPTG